MKYRRKPWYDCIRPHKSKLDIYAFRRHLLADEGLLFPDVMTKADSAGFLMRRRETRKNERI